MKLEFRNNLLGDIDNDEAMDDGAEEGPLGNFNMDSLVQGFMKVDMSTFDAEDRAAEIVNSKKKAEDCAVKQRQIRKERKDANRAIRKARAEQAEAEGAEADDMDID